MNWYKQVKLAQKIDGEFWLVDGIAMFADSNIGVGHEGYVIQTIIDDYGIDETQLYRTNAQDKEEVRKILTEQCVEPKEIELLIDYFFGINRIDPREYAMREWGWKRLVGPNVQTWTLTDKDLKSMGRGIWDAYGEIADEVRYDLYVDGSSRMYEGIPLYVFDDGRAVAMRNFERKSFGGLY